MIFRPLNGSTGQVDWKLIFSTLVVIILASGGTHLVYLFEIMSWIVYAYVAVYRK